MSDPNPKDSEFLKKLEEAVEVHLSEESFGVSELAGEMDMSRSNLLRKVKKLAKLSVSQYIRQVRLKKAMEMLRQSALNVSEVAYKVGFSSTSYFIKCFREYYGYPPGEVGKRSFGEVVDPEATRPRKKPWLVIPTWGGLIALLVILAVVFFRPSTKPDHLEKSIAVLPFINDSNDSSNVYLINGLMESTLNNLQKIGDLRVISRTSSEKYRNTHKSIPEMAEELDVNYIVEGSGQKIGDHILLNIQLIDASRDRHLWAKQYRRETRDIFGLQQEIAKNIAEEIQVVITPEEEERIDKIPTHDLVAYDHFLKGVDFFARGGDENLKAALPHFEKAMELDNGFALAYAEAALVYYYLDLFQEEKKYGIELGNYADKALLLDSRMAESLMAKAAYYIHKEEHESALPYLEKALEYNPNSATVIGFLTDFYHFHVPNTAKYLEYALKGVKLAATGHDSVTASNNYLRLSHALLQLGFLEEALTYADRSIQYNPFNSFSGYLRTWILFFLNRDFEKTRELLITDLNNDTTRLDVLQEVGKICLMMEDYDSAYYYYKRLIERREALQLDIYKHENLAMGIVLGEMGLKDESERLIRSYKEFADNDRSVYKHLFLMAYYSHMKDVEKAVEHLKLFSKEDNYVYWILLWDIGPENDLVHNHPEFRKIMSELESKFWENHRRVKATLEEEGLI